ncbi:MAG: LecA/PA-IL family lectin [Vicinamibacterales bacterium]
MSRSVLLGLALVAAAPLVLTADTLILRDGTRVRGELLQIRNGVVEFEEARAFGRSRTLRLDRDDILRIEFDQDGRFDNGLVDDDRGGRGDRDDGRRPAGLRERVVNVSARAGWTPTGISVRAGQTVYFEASGQVRWGRDRRDGPAGERNSPENPGRPLPTRSAAALIGRIGDSGDVFLVGDETGAFRMRDSGPLYLGVNDDFLNDNSGTFRVVVYY